MAAKRKNKLHLLDKKRKKTSADPGSGRVVIRQSQRPNKCRNVNINGIYFGQETFLLGPKNVKYSMVVQNAATRMKKII